MALSYALPLLAVLLSAAVAQDGPLTISGEVEFVYKNAWRHSSRAQPPPRGRPPPFGGPPLVANEYQHTPDMAEMQIRCPQIIGPQRYPLANPSCQMPSFTVAYGPHADAFREFGAEANAIEVAPQGRGPQRGYNNQCRSPQCAASKAVRDRLTRKQAENRILNGDRAIVELEEAPAAAGAGDLEPPPLGRSPEGKVPAFVVKRLVRTSMGEQKCGIDTGTPHELRALVFIMDWSSCGPEAKWKPSVTEEELTQAFAPAQDSSGTTIPANMRAYHQTCSFGHVLLDPSNVMVLPVPMPCRGVVPGNLTTRPGMPPPASAGPPSQRRDSAIRMNATVDDWWDYSRSCEVSEQKAWENACEAHAQQLVADGSLGQEGTAQLDSILTWTEGRRNIYIVPQGATCGWEGYGDVACTTPTCSV
ncbi:Autolysin [Tetrabaena socialis]|uniref:Autolysin n=1 Tax=Tetrabaena socialis TaxID=47790 RepID=A0A2J8ADK6_9CHLO|nr:Autolysin [Tetrabaena socialis]|eukprot:PNH10589.1 Autolysin [Tetrabaena socialis]